MTPNGRENRIRTWTNSIPNNRNSSETGVRLGGNPPHKVGNADIQDMHQAVRRGCRKHSYVLKNIMHMGLRDVAQPGKAPLRKLTGADALSSDVDQPSLKLLEIHPAPIQLYFFQK